MDVLGINPGDTPRYGTIPLDEQLVAVDHFEQIRDAIIAIAGSDGQTRKVYEQSLERLRRPIVAGAVLVSDAREAIGGSRAALDRLVTAFVVLSSREGESLVPTPPKVPTRIPPGRRDDDVISTRPLVSEKALGVLTLALSYASLVEPDAAKHMRSGFGSLLEGLMVLDLLWALSPDVLQGNEKAGVLFHSALDWLGTTSRVPVGSTDFPLFPGLPEIPEKLKVIPFDRREWLGRLRCFETSIKSLSAASRLPLLSPYRVTAITLRACTGQVVTITGSGFGASPGRVSFPTMAGAAILQPSTWTDTEVTVTVPANASSGQVELLIPAGTATTCAGEALTLYKPRLGDSYFDGSAPQVISFTANTSASQLRVDPSSVVTFRWKACPSDAVIRLLVTEIETGVLVLDRLNLPSKGQLAFQIPAYLTLRSLRCMLEASGTCPPSPAARSLEILVAPLANVAIDGMEVTQGIQQFWRTGITENSISTVAGKETIVRVYVSADMNGFNNDEVSEIWGVLEVGGLTLSPINGITPTNPTGGNPFFRARRRTAIDRENVNHTMNFRIPSYLCHGTQQLFCYLVVPGPKGGVDQTVGKLMNWSWDVESPLKVRWVRIRDEHDPVNVAPTTPTDAQCRTTVQRALEVLPFPPSDIGAAPVPTHTTTRDFAPFTPAGDVEGAALRLDIDNLRAGIEVLGQFGIVPFDPQERWVGFTVPWFRGWGAPNTCIAPIYQGGSWGERLRTAHELGHTLGLCHLHETACLEARGLTAEPTLEDVAFDPFSNKTIAGTGHDFMSYTASSENWITSLNWNAARAAI